MTPPLQSRSRELSPVASRLLWRAQSELGGGHAEAAAQTLTNVLALAPDSMEAVSLMGVVAQARGDHAKAVECFRRALAVWPDDPDLHGGLGIALYECGEIEEAVTVFRRTCELAPGMAAAWYNLGKALKLNVQTEQACDALRRALAIDPALVPARLELARAQASLGQVGTAVREFREVLRRQPENARAWFGLSNLNTVRFDAEDTESIRRAFARGDGPTDAHDLLGFAVAKALEDQGDHARAFEVFRVVNASQRRRVKWDAAGARRRMEAILGAFANGMPAPLDPALGREAILIVSIPRSGSTLVEQILASHPEVEGANEIKDLPQVIDAEARHRGSAFPMWVPDATAGDWQRLGEEYLARTTRWRERKPRFTDKNMVSWYLVGTALAMLPAARVVVVRRDPLETCLACFRQRFTGDTGFAYDLDEMADYCIDFMRLTRFWLDKYPERVFDLEYEALVTEPEAVIPRLLDFCGLPFDPACLDFHKTSRTVLSAPSAAQVRQPLRRDTARTTRYGDKLDHLRERLRDAGLLAE